LVQGATARSAVTPQGGTIGSGTVFKLNTNGTVRRAPAPDLSTTGGFARGLVQGTDGALYGTAPKAAPLVRHRVQTEHGWNRLEVLVSFSSEVTQTPRSYVYSGLAGNGRRALWHDPSRRQRLRHRVQAERGWDRFQRAPGPRQRHRRVPISHAHDAGTDGALYGTTSPAPAATAPYSVNPDGTGFLAPEPRLHHR
jgi:hypothetical protein